MMSRLPVERLNKVCLVIFLCKCGLRTLDVSKNNAAWSLKLGHLIEDNE